MLKFLVSVTNSSLFGILYLKRTIRDFHLQLTFGAGVYTGVYLSQNYEVSGQQ